MVKKILLEELAEGLVSFKLLTSITGTISDRAKRRYEKIGKSAYEILKTKKKLPEDSNLLLNLTWTDKSDSWARNLSLAIEEFKQKYPGPGLKLVEIIGKHRKTRRAYLEFGLTGGELPPEIYIKAIQKIAKGLGEEEARNVYESVRILEKVVKKKEEKTHTLLLSE